MARSKSTSGTKSTRGNEAAKVGAVDSNLNKEQTDSSLAANAASTSLVEAGATRAESISQAAKSPAEPRKLEMVKTEQRKNVVVPIKLEDEIRRRAYELYVQRGNTPGSEAEDWLTAEREVRERYKKQQSA